MFIQNNTNMEGSRKSVVVKQWGAAGSGSLPTSNVNWLAWSVQEHRLGGPDSLAREGLSCALSAHQMTLRILVEYI